MSGFKSPVLIVAFNRFDSFVRVADRVDEARPTKIYISVDGPRVNKPGDVPLQARIADYIASRRWQSDIEVRVLRQNLGAGGHLPDAVSWMFESEEFGVILEDDCLPSTSFFDYVDVVEPLYRDSEVTCVSGFNPTPPPGSEDGCYHRSRFPMTWGWATWRVKWAEYSNALGSWTGALPVERLRTVGEGLPWFSQFWYRRFDELRGGSSDVWDYQWIFHTWRLRGSTISPNLNLVQNIGFGRDSTHTFFARAAYRVPAQTVRAEYWRGGESPDLESRRSDKYIHVHFYKVGRAYPLTATLRAVVRNFVNRVIR